MELMAKHLDLEEQEQIDALKHFWNTWGMCFLMGRSRPAYAIA